MVSSSIECEKSFPYSAHVLTINKKTSHEYAEDDDCPPGRYSPPVNKIVKILGIHLTCISPEMPLYPTLKVEPILAIDVESLIAPSA